MSSVASRNTNKRKRTSRFIAEDSLFSWTEKATKASKRSRSGDIRAKNRAQAIKLLKSQGIKPNHIQKVNPNDISGPVALPVLSDFVRQLAVMLQAGVSITEAMSLVISNLNGRKKDRIRMIARAIRNDIETGLPLSEAMAKYPRCFDSLFCSTIASGEQAGQIETVLSRLANLMEKSMHIRKKTRKALVYPCIVLIIAAAVTLAMLLFVLPKFETMYSSFGAELPGLTQFLLSTSNFLRNQGWMLIVGGIVVVFGFLRIYRYNQGFKSKLDGVLLRVPLFGLLLRTAFYARWTRTMNTLTKSGVPITDALTAVQTLSHLKAFRVAGVQLLQEVTTGIRLSDAMENTREFEMDICQLVRVGEESGQLDDMLGRTANLYEGKLDDLVDNLSTIMEPALMAIVGGLVGVLIIGMYMPMFEMGNVV